MLMANTQSGSKWDSAAKTSESSSGVAITWLDLDLRTTSPSIRVWKYSRKEATPAIKLKANSLILANHTTKMSWCCCLRGFTLQSWKKAKNRHRMGASASCKYPTWLSLMRVFTMRLSMLRGAFLCPCGSRDSLLLIKQLAKASCRSKTHSPLTSTVEGSSWFQVSILMRSHS